MKRFIIFAGLNYYPECGWKDFFGMCDTYEEAIDSIPPLGGLKFGWWQLFDTREMKIIRSSDA